MNFLSHIKSGRLTILVGMICFFMPNILSWIYPEQQYKDSLIVSIVLYVLFVLPAIILHLNYYLVNTGDILKFSRKLNEFTFVHKGQITKFNPNEIDHVVWSVSFNEFENRVGIVPWEGYNHHIIYLTNGKVITITSLLIPGFILPIGKEKIIVKQNFYRLAKIR